MKVKCFLCGKEGEVEAHYPYNLTEEEEDKLMDFEDLFINHPNGWQEHVIHDEDGIPIVAHNFICPECVKKAEEEYKQNYKPTTIEG